MNPTMPSLDEAVARCMTRINERKARALNASLHDKDPVIRKMMHDYVHIVYKRRPEFMLAGLHCEAYADHMFKADETLKDGALEELIVKPPARWDFIHTYVFGDVADAVCCYNRYDACKEYLGVYPMDQGDPWHALNVMMRHKDSSPWYQRLKRRRELKKQLGRRLQSLVGYARGHTKAEFIKQFYTPAIPKHEMEQIHYASRYDVVNQRMMPGRQVGYTKKKGDTRPMRLIPEITEAQLLHLTGYTPEGFWREVKKPNTVPPKRPQLELTLQT